MTYSDLRYKLVKRFYWIILVILLFYLISFNWLFTQTYLSLYTFKFPLKPDYYNLQFQAEALPQRVILDSNGMATGYSTNTKLVSNYMESYFSSGEAQNKIYLSSTTSQRIPEEPLYAVTLLGESALELRNEFTTEDAAKDFNKSAEDIVQKQVDDWNNTHPLMLQIKIVESTSQVIPQRKGIQMQALPLIAGIITGLALTILVPQKKNKNNKNLTSSVS
jgi:hypothetical protein